jgi:dipeptidyl-peptidase 4
MKKLMLVLGICVSALAQERGPAVTAADYQRAERFLGSGVSSLVVGGEVSPTWLPAGRFWYRRVTASGAEYVLIDPEKGTRTAYSPTPEDTAGRGGRRRRSMSHPGGPGSTAKSPDGKKELFVRAWNLWVRLLETKEERQLTTDGVENFGYATDNAGWTHSDRPVALWSPDSKKIATQQQDERNAGTMYIVHPRAGHPTLESWKYPMPGDSVVPMIHRVIVDAETGSVVRIQTPPDFHRSTFGDDLLMSDYNWSPDGSRLAFVSVSRDHREVSLRVAEAATGEVRTLFTEKSPTHFESVAGWRVLWSSGAVIWSSERDNWSHLYRYDLFTGKLVNRITSGEGVVKEIVSIDEAGKTVTFRACGREPGEDPYYIHYYRIGLDGTNLVALTPDAGNHAVQFSPDGKYLIDTRSTPDVPPVVSLRDARGKLLLRLEEADISKLLSAGWKPPMPVTMKARDGKTDIYGLLFRPGSFDPSKKYPIVNYAYPGPQEGSVGPRSFSAARGDCQALAELGFVVVAIDGMGTPDRSKSFHDAYYGAMGRDNTLPDQVSGMKQLASRYSWIDIDRAGMYGHSGGGFITCDAMFRYPDFFKVGVAESGNHDQRIYEDDWGERYQGLLARNPDGSDNYAPEANQSLAGNLKGHLLLAHGMVDDNVPPYSTLLVVEELIRANKDFDLLIFPNQRHMYGRQTGYMTRRRWDYFVRWLLGAEPPKEFEFAPGPTRMGGGYQ